MSLAGQETWCRTADLGPTDGQRVLAYFSADEDGPELWVVLEYHIVPAKRSYNWHWPGNPEAEYSTPTFWQPLERPEALTDEEKSL